MTLLSSVIAFARTQAQTNSDGLTDDNALIFANEALSDFHRRLIEKSIDASQLQESSIVGTANIGVYSYPTNPCSIIALKTIEINYTDSSNDNFKVGKQVDVANLPANTSFSWLRTNADPNNPQFDDRGDKFEIFPTPTAGTIPIMKMLGFAKPSIYTAVNNTVSYPENLDMTILGWRIAANHLYSLGGENMAKGDAFNARYEQRVDQYISTLSKGSQQPLQATPLQITGWEF